MWLEIAKLLLTAVTAVVGMFSAKKALKAEDERIDKQNALNLQQYEREREDNSILSQTEQAREAGYNLNFFTPSYVPSSGSAQTAGVSSPSANFGNLLKGLSNLTGGVAAGIGDVLTRKQKKEQMELQSQYHDAQIQIAKDQLEELRKLNSVRKANIEASTEGIKLNNKWIDILKGDQHNESWLRGLLMGQEYNFNQDTLLDRKSILSSKAKIAEADAAVAKLKSDFEKKYHTEIYDDAFWTDLKNDVTRNAFIKQKEFDIYNDYINDIYPLEHSVNKRGLQFQYDHPMNWLNYVDRVTSTVGHLLGGAASGVNTARGLRRFRLGF